VWEKCLSTIRKKCPSFVDSTAQMKSWKHRLKMSIRNQAERFHTTVVSTGAPFKNLILGRVVTRVEGGMHGS
jgi:hypothetical protein